MTMEMTSTMAPPPSPRQCAQQVSLSFFFSPPVNPLSVIRPGVLRLHPLRKPRKRMSDEFDVDHALSKDPLRKHRSSGSTSMRMDRRRESLAPKTAPLADHARQLSTSSSHDPARSLQSFRRHAGSVVTTTPPLRPSSSPT